MPKGLPKHRQVISIGTEPNNMPDADSIRIAPLKPVGDAQRATPALLAPGANSSQINAATLRDLHTVNQGGRSPHAAHCHQYLAISQR
jgi:hypothetical protein